jgi:hypothetical protein
MGLGTASPDALLTVSGVGAFGAGAAGTPSIARSSDLDTGFWFPAANTLAASTGGSERLRVDSSGRLLVGTSTSRLVTAGTSGGWNPRLQVTKTGVDAANIAAYSFSTYAGDLGGGLGIGPDIVLARSNSDTEGTQAAIANNMLLGRISFNGSDGTAFQGGAFIAAAADGQTWASGDCPTRLVFSTTADGASSPTERMRINSAGALKVGGTISYISATDATNEITTNSATSEALIAYAHSSSYTGSGALKVMVNRNTTDNSFYAFSYYNRVAGLHRFRIADSGNATNTNNSYGAISDIKLKENIVDANSQWDDLKALQVRNYNFKEGQTHTQIGLVAQEVELVSPGLVSESPDRDEDGNDLGTVTKSVNYSVLYMKAVKALQEAMERIETLESKVASLESQQPQ